MDRLVIIGASYRHAPIATLGEYALPKEEVELRLPQIAATIGAPELAYVGTCNRIEFILAGDENTPPETYRERLARALKPTTQVGANSRTLRAWQGDGAAEHLLLVASGLDSARRGEAEIRTQVRAAWQAARRAGTSGPILDRLFADALKTASEVQSFISGQIGVMSLSDCALGQLSAHLNGRRANIVLVGVSPMTRRCAQALSGSGHTFTVASRTRVTAQTFADELGATALRIDDLRAASQTFDVIIAATGGQEIVLTAVDIKRLSAPSGLFVVDFGVPANIDPAAADLGGVRLLDMDHLIEEARAQTTAENPEMAMAREIVDRHLDRLRDEMALRQAGPAIKNVIAHYQAITKASIDNELGAVMPTGADQQRLRQWADLMARRFLHTTLAGVRALATHADSSALNAFLRGLNESVPNAQSDEARDLSGDSKQ
jgi:glutamyl-tRNA reductase